MSVQQKSLFLCQTLAAKLIGMLGFTQPFFHLLARFWCKTKGGLQGGFYATGPLQPLVFPSKLAYKERQNLTLWSWVPNSVHPFILSQIHSSSPTYNITLFLAQSQHLLVGVYIGSFSL